MKQKISTTVLTVFFLLGQFFLSTPSVQGTDFHYAFSLGEKLTYTIKWSFIPAGESTLEVLPYTETVNGHEVFHFVMTSQTNSVVDAIYKVRDRIDSYIDTSMTHSILSKKVVNEGRTHRDIVVNFDWDKNEAQYSNFNEKQSPISILDGTMDPLSAFFFFRLIPLNEKTEVQVPITDGKKCVIGYARVVKQEKIRVAAGKFDTFLIVPDLKDVGGVFEKSSDATMYIWVTADHRRIPVMLQSKVIVGSFYAELTSMTIP